jgi:hypothetical protein
MKMHEKVLKALKGSIKKWEKICYKGGEDRRFHNCPLCKLFSVAWGTCGGCPVCKNSLSHKGCENTPWAAWKDHHTDEHHENRVNMKIKCPECKKLAEKELNFLKSLLPKGI